MKIKNILRRTTALLLTVAVAAASFTGCKGKDNPSNGITEVNKVSAEFDTYLHDLFLEEVTSDTITLNYSLADYAKYGITDYEVTYGDLDLTKLDDTSDIVEELKELKKFDYSKLTNDQKMTYDLLKRKLETELEYSDLYLYEKILSPTIGLQSQLPVVLAEYSFRTKQDIYDYIELINQSDDYFDYILAIVKMQSEAGLFMEDEIADEVIDQCRLFIEDTDNNYMMEIFNDKVMAFDGLSDDERTDLMNKHKNALLGSLIPAYEHTIDVLTSLKGTNKYKGGLCNYPEGAKYYDYLIKQSVGTDRSVDMLDKLLDEYIKQGIQKMAMIYMKSPDIFDSIDNYEFCETEPKAILEDMRARSLADFPKLPECDYDIKYVHPSLEEHMSPAFYMIPALDEYDKNSIYINQKSMDEGQELYSTLAHEGFPGHLLQNVYYLSTNPDPMRTMLNFSGYAEGWATYVEFQCYEMGGIDEKTGALLSANSLITLCVYGKIDIGVNAHGWTKADVKDFLLDYFGELDDEVIDEIYIAMVAEPGNYLKYICGAIEFMKLRDVCEYALGEKFSALDFHTAVLNAGPCDFTSLSVYVKNALGVAEETSKPSGSKK